MPDIQLQFLGPPQIMRDGQIITVNTRKAIALSAYLAVTNRGHNRDTLIALLWPTLDQQRGRAALRTTLSVLKKALGGVGLIVENERISLDLSVLTCDVAEFTTRLAGNTPGHTQLDEAAALYHDDFMAGFSLTDSTPFDDWQQAQTDHFRRQLGRALQQLTQDNADIDVETAVKHAQRWTTVDPLHEPAHHRLMQLYAASGQRSAALRQYQMLHRLLAKDLGVAPAATTTALYVSLRDAGQAFPAKPATITSTAPLPGTLLVGREVELAQIRERLADPACRLLTLVGPGGIGKTRLALAVTQEYSALFADGCTFVPLSSVGSADLLMAAAADALGFAFYGRSHPQQQLLNYLREKRLLLILDNFEHLLSGIDFVTAVLQQAPDVKLLVTSRERLNLQSEWVLPVSGLAYPVETIADTAVADGCHPSPTTYSAIQLFLQAAQRSAPGFEVDLPAIATICQSVDGLPLGIELAAAWVRALPCGEIAQEIGRNFDFLTTHWRDLPARHRSLRAVFDHSWALLTNAEQAVFRQLSIFHGSFDRAAAEAVTGAELSQLVMLADKSLLRRLENGRYTIPEALRAFAAAKRREQPHEQRVIVRRHGRYFADLLQQWEPHLKGGRQTETLAAISADIENVRRAWSWAVRERDTAVLDQSLVSLALFYEMRAYFQEGLTAFRDAAQLFQTTRYLASGSQQTSDEKHQVFTHARLLARQGRFSHRLGRYNEARTLLEESLAILPPQSAAVQPDIAFAYNDMGYVAWSQGHYEAAEAYYQQSLTIYRQLNDKWGQSHVLNNLAILPQNLAETRTLLQESRDIAQEMADLWGLARVLNNLGIVTEDKQAARQLYQESAAICEEIGDRFLSTFPLTNLGHAARQAGEFEEAQRFYAKSLAICREIGYLAGAARNFGHWGTAACALGNYTAAAERCQTGLTICQTVGDQRGQGLLTYTMGLIAIARDQFVAANDYFQQSLTIFQESGERQGIAWPLLGLARLALQQGQFPAARVRAQESRLIFEEVGDKNGLAQSLVVMGWIDVILGDVETAVTHLRQSLTLAANQQAIPIVLESVAGIARCQIQQANKEQAIDLLNAVWDHPGTEAMVREQVKQLRSELDVTAGRPTQPILSLDKIVSALLIE